jgi:hypothetical protein
VRQGGVSKLPMESEEFWTGKAGELIISLTKRCYQYESSRGQLEGRHGDNLTVYSDPLA